MKLSPLCCSLPSQIRRAISTPLRLRPSRSCGISASLFPAQISGSHRRSSFLKQNHPLPVAFPNPASSDPHSSIPTLEYPNPRPSFCQCEEIETSRRGFNLWPSPVDFGNDRFSPSEVRVEGKLQSVGSGKEVSLPKDCLIRVTGMASKVGGMGDGTKGATKKRKELVEGESGQEVEKKNGGSKKQKSVASGSTPAPHLEVPVEAGKELRVNPGRARVVKKGEGSLRAGPVVWWMSRDQRVRDNWALLWAAEKACGAGVPLLVVFNLVDKFLGAGGRHYGFMLRGLEEVAAKFEQLQVPFFLLQGDPETNVPDFVSRTNASLLVMDFSPLRIGRQWRDAMCRNVGAHVSVHEVDAHNVVPLWVASEKQEYAARTIRSKIHRNLNEYLREYPPLKLPEARWEGEAPPPVDWSALIEKFVKAGAEVPEVDWCMPGEDAGLAYLLDEKKGFVTKRLARYSDDRNDPGKAMGVSGLSPWLHYGQLAGQRCALEVRKARSKYPKSADAFLEELIVRSELADNYCYYQQSYDSVEGAYEWAKESLRKHANDPREHLYTREELEKGKTYDKLWNAAQLEMVHYGKMHGFMRMYWAKKILEWTPSPEQALEVAIFLNDKYSLDGRDSNGYVGCMWSICGIHDQGWGERPVFGKIRYMNYAGCKRKFNVDGYIMYVDKLMVDTKKKLREKAMKEGVPSRTAGDAPVAVPGTVPKEEKKR